MSTRLGIKKQRASLVTVSRAGETYELGKHLLVCGDCTAPDVARPLLARAEGDLLVCMDPPYSAGSRQEAGKRKSESVGRQDAPEAADRPIHRDNLTTVGYQTLLLFALSHPGERAREAYVFCDWRMWTPTEGVLEGLGLSVVSQIVWDKLVPGLGKGWRKRHELVAHAARDDAADHAFEAGRPGCHGDVVSEARDRTWGKFHPTPKPVAFVRKLIANTDHATVYDPFAGIGATVIASELEGRRALAIEIDPTYCDVTRRRWGAFAAKQGIEPGSGAL